MVAGLMTAFLLMLYIFVHSVVTKARYHEEIQVNWGDRAKSVADLMPSLVLIFTVLGLLYLGLATATEVSALGVVGAIVISALYRRLTPKLIHDSVLATARTTSMVGLIIIAALLLNFVLSGLRLPAALANMISGLPLPAPVVMLLIIFFYIALGTFMDGFAMMVTTLPVLFPVVIALGYDAVWFGVVITMVIEIALISPPDGMVMYVLQGLRKPAGPITDVFYGVLPFMGIYGISLLIMYLLPDIILWPVR
jgi:tripartite ATP-independent transporter DctM subunit